KAARRRKQGIVRRPHAGPRTAAVDSRAAEAPHRRPVLSAVDVIIVNWNGRAQTLACLEAVFAQAGEVESATVTVVDNGSTDGSIGAIARKYRQVRLLPLGKNHGFTGGIAAGLARSPGRNVIFLNNDAVPQPGWLASLVQAIEAAPAEVISVGG